MLVVDDDVRNIFALTSALEAHHMEVVHAENGQEGIDLLKSNPDIEAVLMDIMMPEMDGYEAIAEIRKVKKFKHLPIIALAAKAMKADRDHCLQVGASDYISKPLDIDQLLSLLRVCFTGKMKLREQTRFGSKVIWKTSRSVCCSKVFTAPMVSTSGTIRVRR